MGIGLLNYPKFRGEDNNGNPLTGGLLYTFDAGTSTPRASYYDKDCIIAHTNPVILDARGEAVIYLSGDYKLILTDSDGVLIWTMDDVTGIGIMNRTISTSAPAGTPEDGAEWVVIGS